MWFDENKDGKQDDGEPGIPGVVLEITDEDGNPITDIYGDPVGPTTTDEEGKYTFDNLPIDNKYIVSINREASKESLKNYTPTIENAGDRAIDSSTWTAISEFLDQHEQRDPTLDFGFVLVEPEPEEPVTPEEPEEPTDPERPVEPQEPAAPVEPEKPSEDDDSDLPTTFGEAVAYTALSAVLITLGGALALYDRKRSKKSNK